MKSPMLSIIVTVFNTKDYIVDCFESILSQTFEDFELILVDDCSTDGSGKMCDSYSKKDARIHVIHHGTNKGLIAARATGVLASSGKYITFVDSDDFVDRCSYVWASSGMEKNLDVICFGIRWIFNNQPHKDQRISETTKIYNKSEIRNHIFPTLLWDVENNIQGFNPSCCLKIIKRELWVHSIQLIQGRRFFYGEDLALTAPILFKANSIEISEKVWYNYRIRQEGNLSAYYKTDLFFDDLYYIYCYLRDLFCDIPDFMKQLDYFYIWSVCLRKNIYSQKNPPQFIFLFPFNKVNHGDRIVLYGAGMVGQTYKEQIKRTSFCEVVLWVDKNYKHFQDMGVSSISEIMSVSYDKVLIAIADPKIVEEVKNNLFDIGVQKEKIVS